MIPDTKLDFWIKEQLNVLLIGRHGSGKSSQIIDAFNRAGLKWIYFSAPTMDPWVDFVGIPKEHKDANGQSYLDLIRPKAFEDDTVEAIVFDEFSRGTKKTKNAVMELLQFKSINGRIYKNLKLIWAAINPSDDADLDYDVEPLDPAIMDRFHVHYYVPYEPDETYFTKKYGLDIARAAIAWWKDLDNKIKNQVSPRRLDYALDVYKKNGDLSDILPYASNTIKLVNNLKDGPILDKLIILLNSNDIIAAQKFIDNENNYSSSIAHILDRIELRNFFFPLIASEKLASLLSINHKLLDYFILNCKQYSIFCQLLADILDAKVDDVLCEKIENLLKRVDYSYIEAVKKFMKNPNFGYFNLTPQYPIIDLMDKLQEKIGILRNWKNVSTNKKLVIYQLLENNMPRTCTEEQAITLFGYCLMIIHTSTKYSIDTNYRRIGKMLNQCLLIISDIKQISMSDAIKLCKTKYNSSIFDKLQNKVPDVMI